VRTAHQPAGKTTNTPVAAVPAGVVTVIGPELAPLGIL
jgi:hypothetical protein